MAEAAAENTTTTTTASETQAGESGTQETFDGWLGKQDATIKGLVDSHVGGLKSALESERTDRKEVQRQLNALKAIGDPTELQGKVAQLQATLDEQTVRNEFAEDAHTKGVTNIKLAYLAAKDAGLLGKKDCWENLQTLAPELFQKKTAPPAAAGTGSGAQPNAAPTMNDFLRTMVAT